MKHFSMQETLDFVRRTTPPRHRAQLQRHLNTGCHECRRSVKIWRRFMQFAKKESFYTAPESALRLAQASFSLRKMPAFPGSKVEVAQLVFDSRQPTMAAGVRGSSPSFRQLVYKSGSICVDMHMQPRPGTDSVVLIGHVLNSKNPSSGMRNVPVTLLCEGDKVSHKKTNEVGEFDFGVEEFRDLQLVFDMGKRKMLIIPVPDAEGDAVPAAT